MLHWGWFVLLLQTLGLGLDTNGLINITASQPTVNVTRLLFSLIHRTSHRAVFSTTSLRRNSLICLLFIQLLNEVARQTSHCKHSDSRESWPANRVGWLVGGRQLIQQQQVMRIHHVSSYWSVSQSQQHLPILQLSKAITSQYMAGYMCLKPLRRVQVIWAWRMNA